MSSIGRTVAVAVAVSLVAAACAKVPFTNRKQFTIIPNKQMNQLGAQTYQEMLAELRVIRQGEDASILQRVGERIADQANEPSYDWQFSLIDDEMVNAWCLPGGYIAFYTGILPVLRSEAGMAFVMGHEAGHAIARHGAERMSQQLGISGALGVISAVLSGGTSVSGQQRETVMAALGMGAQVGVMLPFSRAHEREADTLGLMYMAGAGYPPREALPVWDRMAEVAGSGGPEFLSTHPSHATRQDNIREWMPEAAKRYRRNALGDGVTKPIW